MKHETLFLCAHVHKSSVLFYQKGDYLRLQFVSILPGILCLSGSCCIRISFVFGPRRFGAQKSEKASTDIFAGGTSARHLDILAS